MTPENQIGIKEIARRCNVSIGTVDRVLHNRGEVAAGTRLKVLQMIEESRFQPNILASSLALRRPFLFATLLPTPVSNEGYWNKPQLGILKRTEELSHYRIKIESFQFSQYSPADYRKQSVRMLDLYPDGVIMAPYFFKESIRLVSEIKERKIPFVFIDSDISGQGQLAYVGQNSFKCGQVSARLLSSIANPEGSFLIIHFAKEMDNQNHLVQRERGFYQWLSENSPGRNTRTVEICIPEEEDCSARLNEIFRTTVPAGIFVTNSKVHLAAAILEKSGFRNIRLIGHDLLKENVHFLRKGLIDFLICQRPEEQGYNALDKLFRNVVQKVTVEDHDYTPIDIIIKENLDYYKEFK